MIAILGISAFYHDSAATLVIDGRIVAAAQEERFTRNKHDESFPTNAVQYCLRQAELSPDDLTYVVFYEKPLQKFDRLLETYLAFAPAGLASFSQAIPLWLKEKLHQRKAIRIGIGANRRLATLFTTHHESHAASAFYPSPFDEAAVVTVDGVGEWTTASIAYGHGHQIDMRQEMRFPHSLGLLYSAFTYYCGFKVNSGEYKLMGLAPYGRPVYRDQIVEKLMRIYPDGSIWLDMTYFNYCHGLTMTSKKFHDLFGAPPRSPESELSQRHMDFAASIQAVTEEVILKMCLHARDLTGSRNLCLAGGVALNCVANGKLLASGEFDDVFVQPAAGDAGGSLGAALLCWHQLLEKPRTPQLPDAQFGSLLGPSFDEIAIRVCLDEAGATYECIKDESQLLDIVADALAGEQVVGWFQGRMEFGPRALGCRSILGDARSAKMQAVMNRKIKFRESFRPFAPCVLREATTDYFDFPAGKESPYMLMVAPVHPKRIRQLTATESQALHGPDLRQRVNVVRSDIPAVTHVDFSARVQTVDPERHGRYYRLIKRFAEKTDCPVIINTSFNVRGEPIVGSPENALHCFLHTDMDMLVLENFILRKSSQLATSETDRERYRQEFPLD